MITEDFAPWGVASQIRSRWPAHQRQPPAGPWVGCPGL